MADFYMKPANILGRCRDWERFHGSGCPVCVFAASQIYASSQPLKVHYWEIEV
jgi:hypothetical protein